MRVLFLDIDGVLLPFGDGGPPTESFPGSCLAAFAFIIEQTRARIVLSSTWRCVPSAKASILRQFNEHGGALAGTEFADTTSLSNHSERQWEIAEWLDSAAGRGVQQWVALDDEELLDGPALAARRSRFVGHVVKTESHVGLTHELAQAAVSLIREHNEELSPNRHARLFCV